MKMAMPYDTLPAPPCEMPIRAKSLFNHLNYDVRCMIYDLLDLPPISHACLGLVLSCREALAETEQAAVRGLNRRLADLGVIAVCRSHRHMLNKFPLGATFADLNKITIELCWSTGLIRYPPVLEALLSYYFSQVAIVCKATTEFEAGSSQIHGDVRGLAALGDWDEYQCITKAYFVIDQVLYRIADYEFGKTPEISYSSMDSSFPVRTKTIAVVWGDIPNDVSINSSDLKYIESHYSRLVKDMIGEGTDTDTATYSWPMLGGYRVSGDTGETGMLFVSSDRRWLDGLHGDHPIEFWAGKKGWPFL